MNKADGVIMGLALVAMVLILSACTTPKYTMKNPKTGQVVIVGGDATPSLAGGAVGYHIQKGNDKQRVADYEREGFELLSVEGAD